MTPSPWLDLWFLDLSGPLCAQDPERWCAVLTPDERHQAERYRDYHRREQAIAARALLRRALSFRHDTAPTDWPIAPDAQGRPRLADGSATVDFNIAHTDGMVVCAVSDACRVGVDLEHHDRTPQMHDIHERFLSASEQANLASRAPAAAAQYLLHLWTLKEAWAKALGDGLRIDFRTAEFDIPGPPQTGSIRLAGAPEWRFRTFPRPSGHLIALAWRGPDRATIRARDAAQLMGIKARP